MNHKIAWLGLALIWFAGAWFWIGVGVESKPLRSKMLLRGLCYLAFCAGYAAMALLSGCVIRLDGVHRWQPPLEDAYQVIASVDYAQSVNGARRRDCYREEGWPTESVISSTPSTNKVWEWWALQATVHAQVSDWLLREADANGDSPAFYYLWQVLTIGNEAYTVAHETRMGLKPFGDGADPRCALKTGPWA